MGIKKEKITATRMPMQAPFKLVEENDETEYCVRCGTATRYNKTDNVVFRNNYIDSDGISKDDVYFSIIKEEWPQLKSTVFLGFIGSRDIHNTFFIIIFSATSIFIKI